MHVGEHNQRDSRGVHGPSVRQICMRGKHHICKPRMVFWKVQDGIVRRSSAPRPSSSKLWPQRSQKPSARWLAGFVKINSENLLPYNISPEEFSSQGLQNLQVLSYFLTTWIILCLYLCYGSPCTWPSLLCLSLRISFGNKDPGWALTAWNFSAQWKNCDEKWVINTSWRDGSLIREISNGLSLFLKMESGLFQERRHWQPKEL